MNRPPGVRETALQLPVAQDRLRDDWDVVVVGAGPAGSIAALHLASAGHRVMLLDREWFPRDKVCGDGLIPDALRVLRRAGIEDEVRDRGHGLRRLSVFSPSRIEVEVEGDFVTLKRLEFDALLAGHARERGAVFCRGEVTAVETTADGSVACSLAGIERRLRARAALIATGARVRLLRDHGLVRRERPSGVALRCYVRSSLDLDRMVISYDRSVLPGYAWIFPLGGGEFNVGCGVFYRNDPPSRGNLRTVFHEFCERFPLMRRLLEHAEGETALQGAPLRCGLEGVSSAVAGHVLAIGETLGTTYPFSGEGIGKAMETGELAAGVLHEALRSGDTSALPEFDARLRRELARKYDGYKIAERFVSRAWVIDFMAHRARRSPFLRKAMAGILAETEDPGPLFSWKGLLLSYVR